MKITGGRKLGRQLKDLPGAQRRHVSAMIEKSADEAVRIAKVLVPRDRGDLAETIRKEMSADGMSAEVTAGSDEKRSIIQAYTVEGGRDAGAQAGAMAAQPFIRPARAYLAKKHMARIKRAINKAAKEVTRG